MSRPTSGATLAVGGWPAPVPRDPRRASDRVYDELLAAIHALLLRPGDVVSEQAITSAMGVSRTPVREALARLAQDGLIVVSPQVDTRVAKVRLSELEDAQFVREHLEVAAVSLLCADHQASREPLHEQLRIQVEAMAAGDQEAFFAADHAFHQAIFRLSGRGGALRAVQPLKLHLDRARRLIRHTPETLAVIYAEHLSLATAIDRGDSESATRIAAVHSRRILEFVPQLRAMHPDWFTD